MSARGAFVLSIVVYAAVLAVAAVRLPDRVPMHFDASGDADRWAGRTEAVVTFGLLGVSVAGLFALLAGLGGRIPLSLVNVPHKEWWTAEEGRTRRMRGLMRADMYWFAASTLAFFSVLVVLVVRASRLDRPHLDAWFWSAFALYLAALAGYLWYCLRRRYRPEPER